MADLVSDIIMVDFGFRLVACFGGGTIRTYLGIIVYRIVGSLWILEFEKISDNLLQVLEF